MASEPMRVLGSTSISGAVLSTPRPDYSFHVFAERDGETLVLRIAELPDSSPIGVDPSTIAELRVTRGALPRTLDVLRELIELLGAWPDMRSRLNNLESML
jgi:hypothetical protein